MCDFNFFLEDFVDNGKFFSYFLEYVEKENSLCGFVVDVGVEFVFSKVCFSVDFFEKDDEVEEEVVNVKVRSKVRRIVLDGEEEYDILKDVLIINLFNLFFF